MGEDGSLRNCTYGFSDSRGEIYSNLPLPSLHDWLQRLDEINKKVQEDGQESFLNFSQPVVVVDLNQKYLNHVLEKLFPEAISQSRTEKIKSEGYGHHTKDYFVDVYWGAGDPRIWMIYDRVKGRDSLTEKLNRKNAEKGKMGWNKKYFSTDITAYYHVDIFDIYGVTLVAPDEKTCRNLEEEIQDDPRISFLERKDFFEKPNKRGYQAIHNQFIWDGEEMPSGTLLDIHFETIDGFYKHQNIALGPSQITSTKCSRSRYTRETKFDLSHNQGEYQIIILEKNGGFVEKNRIPVINNGFAKYALINY